MVAQASRRLLHDEIKNGRNRLRYWERSFPKSINLKRSHAGKALLNVGKINDLRAFMLWHNAWYRLSSEVPSNK